MHDDGHFDQRIASWFDETYDYQAGRRHRRAMVDLIAELAGDGRALELGIGTERVALPLARRGVPVHGIELSRAMVDRLRAKPTPTQSASPSASSAGRCRSAATFGRASSISGRSSSGCSCATDGPDGVASRSRAEREARLGVGAAGRLTRAAAAAPFMPRGVMYAAQIRA